MPNKYNMEIFFMADLMILLWYCRRWYVFSINLVKGYKVWLGTKLICTIATLVIEKNFITNLCTREYVEQCVSLPGINQSAGSLMFHVLLALHGTAIQTKNNVPTFRLSGKANPLTNHITELTPFTRKWENLGIFFSITWSELPKLIKIAKNKHNIPDIPC
jgi:hypothetical protein